MITGLARGQADPGMLRAVRSVARSLRDRYGEYDPLLARLKDRRPLELLTWYLLAYPHSEIEKVTVVSRDALIGGLLDYADTGLVARQRLILLVGEA